MRFSSRSARQLALAAGVLSFASLTACNKGGGDFAKTKSGIEYKIFKKVGSSYERREIGPDGDPTYKDRVGKFLLGYMRVPHRQGLGAAKHPPPTWAWPCPCPCRS